MGSLILDASVLIALLDRADQHHSRAVEEVEAADQEGDDLVTPASAYSEALVAFARESRVDDAREAIVAMGVEVAPLDARTAERAAALRARHDRLRLPDAMVLATSHQLGGRMLSYDQRLQRYAADESERTSTPEPPTG
jgi:predicted nucleic acid-binding protein